MPAKSTPLLTPKQLTEDCGTHYRDQNAAFYPKHPLEPAVQSILDVRAETRATKLFGTLDLFGCGSTLGNLLRFVQGKSLNFCILVEVVGPVDSVFELKTRSIKCQFGKDAYMQPQLACLWLRQVPNFILAYHNNGLFTDIRVMDIRNEVSEWEKKESAVIRKFVALLRHIVDIARSDLGWQVAAEWN
ncbi:hypothetical protein E4U59_004765 [Claviceps monticola]|nr:hypothetical protein E4U59_004765 [Claviceps monticola]